MLGQGLGRHSAEEVWDMMRADVQALAALLGDKPFFLGEEPTSLDATVHTFLDHFRAGPQNPVADEISAHAGLLAYQARMSSRLDIGTAQVQAA
jgi:glutathione S-transferase